MVTRLEQALDVFNRISADTITERERFRAVETARLALQLIADAGEVFRDERLDYIEVQVDREDFDSLRGPS